MFAQLIWHEGGTFYDSDLINAVTIAAYRQDLTAIGTAILNQWDVDNRRLSVFLNRTPVCPLGQCLSRSLAQIIMAIGRDSTGAIFNSSGQMRSTDAAKLSGILATDTLAGPLVLDSSGHLINRGCEGVLESIVVAAGLLNGGARVVPPNGMILLFWNLAPANSTTTFPGNAGYIGWKDSRNQGETFWGLSGVSPNAPPPNTAPRSPGRGR